MHFPQIINLCCTVAFTVVFNVFKALTALTLILTLDVGSKLASRLKSCFASFLITFSGTNCWAIVCSDDTTAFFLAFYTKNEDLSV